MRFPEIGAIGGPGSEYGPKRFGEKLSRIVLPVTQAYDGYGSSFRMPQYPPASSGRTTTSMVAISRENNLCGGSEKWTRSFDVT